MIKQARPYLILIQEALLRISKYKPDTFGQFVADKMCQDAIAMRLQEIGENFARIRDVTPDYYKDNADETWPKIIGLRNIISHGYHIVEQEEIWNILENHLPGLTERIDQLLDRTFDPQQEPK